MKNWKEQIIAVLMVGGCALLAMGIFKEKVSFFEIAMFYNIYFQLISLRTENNDWFNFKD